MKEIKVNKMYTCYDDGKITTSRKQNVLILDIIPFNNIDKDTKYLWECEVKQCSWLYAEETDYFIKGFLNEGDSGVEIYFARTVDSGWFSLGFWGSRLDVDGSLTKKMNIIKENNEK